MRSFEGAVSYTKLAGAICTIMLLRGAPQTPALP